MTPDKYVALGSQIYRVVKPFASWPREAKAESFSKCAVDSKGNLYIVGTRKLAWITKLAPVQ